jgi:heme-degrading monooxygenase HmoA
MHMTVFRNRKRSGMDSASYARDSERMVELASQQRGFIAYRRYTSDDGESLSIAEWETGEDARAWGRHPEHVAAQNRGRDDYYESYTVCSCDDPRVRHFQRNET